VSEIDINRVKPGQKAIVTSAALPGMTFKGLVKSVGSQARLANGGGGLATFPVTVIVPKLTPKQRKFIRVGMSAKIEISIANPKKIMVPIAAVKQKDGKITVTIVDASGQHKTVPVRTGRTTPMGMVVIESGIKSGEKIFVPGHKK